MKHSSYLPFQGGGGPRRLLARAAKLPLSWQPLVPHRIRRKVRATRSKIRSRQAPASHISALATSWSPADTIASLRAHEWSFYDGQYLFIAILGIFCLSIIETPGPLFKTFVATMLIAALVMPVTRQFFLPFLPIASWLVLFYSCQFISGEYRPPIWVRVLPALENILYGANLSNILSAHKHVVLDVLAWLPYGLCHFGAPFVVSLVLFFFGPPGTTPAFARAFGYMNAVGVTIQLMFPCSPPWYENTYGLAPANYSMPGSPAGLAAIDKLLGIDMYTSGFTASPMVFGAFPSLHAANSTLECLFMSHVFPKLRPVFIAYTLWMWWATMYLSHHYAVDLMAGGLLAACFFFVSKAKFLPRVQLDKMYRWDYDYVEVGEEADTDASLAVATDLYEMFRNGGGGADSADEWTIGSSSSFSTSFGAKSPTDETGSSLWEGDTLASASDHEFGR
ncbi:putative aureobasidin-resistance protein [Lineolata rhizophorae]|uniref:Putative aureobasidin-resistance protein n=1 Tax=Lineolata rhizophorae TaxID=578093 RepID=A0A6A6NUE9_9PEZI|nr:putative aureobasidin-resistance protein [Lineolata rhizophorae]